MILPRRDLLCSKILDLTMAKDMKPAKKRATKYEPRVKFNGSFIDLVKISTPGAGAKKTAAPNPKKEE